MYGYIYKTTNVINGTIYVGQHTGYFNPAYLGSGLTFLKALKKYGKQSFTIEILETANSLDELNALEIKHIAEFRKQRIRMYNIWDGGKGKPIGWKTTPESILKMRLAKLGKKASLETRKKMSESQRKNNPTRSKESNLLRSLKLKGRIITKEWKEKILATKLAKKQQQIKKEV